MAHLKVSFVHNIQIPKPEPDLFVLAYGTGLYLHTWIEGAGGPESGHREYCVTRDGACEFVIADVGNTEVVVQVLKGDRARIQDMVTQEIEHFDCTVEWVD